jgi:hypothetical protein
MARASLFREESRWGYQHWRLDIPNKKQEWEGHWVLISKGDDDQMVCTKKKCPPLKWDYPVAMEYRYPEINLDVGTPFQKGRNWKNPEKDPWMEAQLEKQGMSTPRRFMPKED